MAVSRGILFVSVKAASEAVVDVPHAARQVILDKNGVDTYGGFARHGSAALSGKEVCMWTPLVAGVCQTASSLPAWRRILIYDQAASPVDSACEA